MAMSRLSNIRDFARLLALAMLPFMCASTGAGGGVAWLAGIAVVLTRWSQPTPPAAWRLAAIAGVVAAMIGPVWFRGTPYHLGMVLLALLGAAIVLAGTRLTPRRAVLIAAGGSLAALAFSVATDPGGYLDVGLMHRAGANAVRAGLSPWSGLEVPSGAPGAEGSFITGDPYPPVTLLWYSIGDWISGDPRAGGAVGWLVLVAGALFLRVADHRPVVVMLTSGALPLMLWTGWTELFTVAVLVAAVSLWSRAGLSSVLLGVALASKQYMIVLAPLVAVVGDQPRRLRRLLPLVVAACLALAGFALGEGYLDATVGVYAEFDARPDSASFFGFLSVLGLGVSPPFWLAPVAGLAFAALVAMRWRPITLVQLLGGSARTLAVFFLLGTQAFSNYWFLVWCRAAPCSRPPEPTDRGARHRVVRRPDTRYTRETRSGANVEVDQEKMSPFDRFAASSVAILFGISQPVLDLFGRFPAFFGARLSPRSDIVLLGVFAALMVPGIAGVLSLGKGRLGHLGFFLGTSVGLFAFGARIPAAFGVESDVLWLLCAGVVALGGVWLLEHREAARTFARFLVVAPLVSLAVFLVASSTGQTLRAPSTPLPTVAAPGAPAPIVVIVFDELPLASLITPEGTINDEWYPNFHRLADDSIWYRNAATTQQQTDGALPTILTGTNVTPGSQPVLAEHPNNLFTLLRGHYDLRVVEGLTTLCPLECPEIVEQSGPLERWGTILPDVWVAASHQLLPPTIRSRLPTIAEQWGRFGDLRFRDLIRNDRRSIVDDFIADIANRPDRGRPPLYFLHSMLPHRPWQHLPDGRVIADIEQDPPGLVNRTWRDQWAANLAMQRHLMSVQFTDSVLGEVMSALKASGIYDEALIVVMSDHGISLELDQEYLRKVTDENMGQVGAIPMLVKLPGGEGGGTIDDYRAESPDILPTIADIIEIEVPWMVDGVSLVGDGRPNRERTTAFGIASTATWGVSGQEKYEVASRIEELFPLGDVFNLTLPADIAWLGRLSDDLEPCSECRLTDADLYEDVDPAAMVVPAVVRGVIDGLGEPGRRIGVVVNGAIQAVTYSFESAAGSRELQAAIDPSALRAGANDVWFVELP